MRPKLEDIIKAGTTMSRINWDSVPGRGWARW